MYEVYGLKLGDRNNAESSSFLLHTDAGKWVHISYYMWCIKGNGSVVVVDTGLNEPEIKKRNLQHAATPEAQLHKIGVDPKGLRINNLHI